MKYTINSAFVGMLNEKVAKFAKKFAKYGDGAFDYKVGDSRLEKINGRIESVVDVEINGNYKVNGYEFVASLEFDNGCNIIKKADSSVFVPEIYRTRCECDHCKINRFRKNTVILKKDNEYVQVGKSCVVDYLGVNIENYASYISYFNNIEEYIASLNGDNLGAKSIGYDVAEIVGETIEYVKQRGYISKSASFDRECDSTSTMVWHAINETVDMKGNVIYEYLKISDESKEEANLVIDFCKTLNKSESDYEYNLSVLANNEYVETNNFGLVVSMVATYNKHSKESKSNRSQTVSDYIASVGDKVEFRSTPVCVTSYDSEFGVCYIYKFDVDGNDVIWKTSKFLENVEMNIKGTVKEHNQYKGRKQTVLTRCKATV